MLFWLLWLVVIGGGIYMAAGHGMSAWQNGLEISNVANAVIYGACAAYSLPKFVRFVLKKNG